jgi:2-isopropylmalate synthase
VNPARISIFDTTLRDGEQSPGCSMHLEEKLRLAQQLEKLGVDIVEAGFPVASDGDFEAVKAVAQALRHTVVAGLCRALTGDIDRAWAPGTPASTRSWPRPTSTWSTSSACPARTRWRWR